MRRYAKTAVVGIVAALALAASGSALAYRGHVHFGFYLGMPGPWYGAPAYYPAPYYYPPTVVVPAQAPVYVQEPSSQPPAPAAQNYWYYCPSSKAYYPYVRECAESWLRVVPQPPNG